MLHSPRQGVTEVGDLFHSPRQGVTVVADFTSARQGITEIVGVLHSPRQSATEVWGEEFALHTIALEDVTKEDWADAGLNVWDPPEFTATYAGIDISELIGDCSWDIPLNGKSSASLQLLNPRDEHGIEIEPSDLAPPGYGDFEGIIRQHPTGALVRPFRFHIRTGGELWTSEDYVGGRVSFNRFLSWPLQDATALLDQQTGLTLPDIILAAGDRRTAHSAAREVSTLIGVAVECRYPDYLLGEHRRGTGTPLSWLDALARPMQAARRLEKGVLIYEQIRTDGPVSWDFVDDLNIETLQVDEMELAANSFVLTRFTPGGGQIGEAAGNQVGRQRVTFDPSKFVVIDQIKAINGALLDWVFGSSAGAILAGTGGGGPPSYSGAVPAAWADFTYRPNIGNTVWTPAYEVLARGGPIQKEGTHRFTADSGAAQAVYGVVGAGKAIAEPILGDEAGAALAVQAWLQESIRKGWQGQFRTPFLNPFVRPGQIIRIRDVRRAQLGTRWVVERVKPVKRGQMGSMSIECTRGEF